MQENVWLFFYVDKLYVINMLKEYNQSRSDILLTN